MKIFFVVLFLSVGISEEVDSSWHVDLLKYIGGAPESAVEQFSDTKLNFPTPNGELLPFEIFETPVMPEGLANRYPQIKTYSGRGVLNPNLRVSITLKGDDAKILILGHSKNIYIDKMVDGEYRISNTEFGLSGETIENQISGCGCRGAVLAPETSEINTRDFPYCVGEDEPCFEIGNKLVTYRYAGMMTAEANNEVADGTVEGGLAWIAAMVNQVNLVWVREMSFRLELIEDSDLLIYTDDRPTPINFTAHDMHEELPQILSHIEIIIGPGGYGTAQDNLLWEYAALFNTGYGGGLAYVPGSTSANLPSYAIHIHEIGHNLGSSHNCTSEGGWASTFGGTAMCNRGNTLPGNSGDQYSSHTIDIAIRYQNEPFGGASYDYQRGYSQEPTTNIIPEVLVPEGGFYIPKDTPFVLEGLAVGENNDNLTYSWEQNDAANYGFSPPEFPSDSGPLFCSVDAHEDGNLRYFPYMESLLENNYFTGNIEKLPFASREMNMRLLVRDNDQHSGAFNYKNIRFNVDENSGPFRVTSQSDYPVWQANTSETIFWDVANTNDPNTVNSSEVDILLSIDYGQSFQLVLAENVANDGMHQISVPNLPTLTGARIMVKSADNIFFDINDSFIQVVNNQLPQIGLNTDLISVSTPIDIEQQVIREIQNTGDEGSFLVYETITEIDQDGEGYLTFDGVDDYVDLGANILSGNGDFSISLWVKSSSTNAVIIQQRNGGFNGEHQLKFNGSGQLDFFTYRDGYDWAVVTPNSYNDNNWHHVVVVQSNQISGGYIFVDGVEMGTNYGGVVYLEGSIHSYLGADMRDYNKFLNGSINDVHIFNSALSGNEISTLYNGGFGFSPIYNQGSFSSSNSLVASYPMTAMSGAILSDVLGNHIAEINGAMWSGDLLPTPNWLSVDANNNWLSAGQSELIQLDMNPVELEENSNYMGKLIITSNASVTPIIIPVELQTLTNSTLGDLNLDGVINILDVILVVNLILAGEYNALGDLNTDGMLNILDIVQIVNGILNT
ncbi:MAG: hypothetical protein H8E72_04310 [Candidatus Marinimicrobia bacterium]|nr:hypothetical protein [Candidatus Neomarinimicrobiota bacterium]